MALSDARLRQVRANGKNYTLKDSDGLALYVSAPSSKIWHFRFYWAGQQQRMSFGSYPEIGLKDARLRRDGARALVAKGIDPRVHRRQERAAANAAAANTFEAIFRMWRSFKAMRLKTGRQSMLAQIDRIFGKDILPALRNLSIFEIRRQDLLEVLRKIELRKALNTAAKCRTWLNQLFRFAMVEVNLPQNPSADLDIVAIPQPPVKHHPFLRMHEMPAFLQALRAYGGETKTQLGLWLLLLTGVRTGELRLAMREQLDLKRGLWLIPPEVVKQLQQPLRTTDRSIPSYIVPLSSQASEIFRHLLDEMAPAQRYLLAHRCDPHKGISEGTLNSALKRMGYKGRLTGHGIRATISTALNELGYNAKWVDAQLSHADPDQVSAAYNHAEYVEQRRAMMQDWADRLDAWANRLPDAGEVVVGACSTLGTPIGQGVVSPTIMPAKRTPARAEVADNATLDRGPGTPSATSPTMTDFLSAHVQILASFDAPQNLPVEVFAKLAGKSRDNIHREIKARRLLSISLGHRGQRIPQWQLDPLCQRFVHQVMERAQRTDPWVLYRVLSEPRDDLGGLAPVAAITAGNLADVAQRVLAQLGLD